MSLKRQTLWSMAPLIVVSVLNIFSLPLFFKFFGEEMFAISGYIVTVTGMFGFADLGLGSAVGRYVGIALGRGDAQAAREYWGTGNLIAMPLLVFAGLLFALLGIAFGPLWFDKVAPQDIPLLRACFAVGGAALFLNYYGFLWNLLLQVHLDFKFISVLRVGISLLQVLPALFIAQATSNPFWVNAWGAAAGLMQLLIFIWYARRRHGYGFGFREAKRARAREMSGYIGKTFVTLLTGAFTGMADRLILGRLAPSAIFNPYFVSANVGGRLQSLGGSVMGPVFHNTSRAIGSGAETAPGKIYDEMFHFTFGWYLLATIWLGLWHPFLVQLWLPDELAAKVNPLLTPIVAAFCITGIATISQAQLGPLNRLGVSLVANIATGILTAIGVYVGWRVNGVVGVAYGFLASRIVCIAQDLYVIRLVNARGWLALRTWAGAGFQCLVGAAFALVYLGLPQDSILLVFPAMLHGGLVAAWLLREPLRRFLKERGALRAGSVITPPPHS